PRVAHATEWQPEVRQVGAPLAAMILSRRCRPVRRRLGFVIEGPLYGATVFPVPVRNCAIEDGGIRKLVKCLYVCDEPFLSSPGQDCCCRRRFTFETVLGAPIGSDDGVSFGCHKNRAAPANSLLILPV